MSRNILPTVGRYNPDRDRPELDYYATDPRAAGLLLQVEKFAPVIWEPACGEGHISKPLMLAGHKVLSTDIFYRGFGSPEPLDFLESTIDGFNGDIVTNPPYKYAVEFVEAALKSVIDGRKVAMFLKLLFLESKQRRALFDEQPPQTVYVSSSRLVCAKNGDFESCKGDNAMAYAWFVWVKGWRGETVVKWIN